MNEFREVMPRPRSHEKAQPWQVAALVLLTIFTVGVVVRTFFL